MGKVACIVHCCALQLLLAAGMGLALAACTKCDMPTWRHDAVPASCHDDDAAK